MKFERLVKEGKLFWPSNVAISDGNIYGPEGGYFPTLSEVWRKAEDSQSSLNEWHDLMCWAIFCGYHELACKKLKAGDLSVIRYEDLDFQYVEDRFLESLMGTYPSRPKFMRSQYKKSKTHNNRLKALGNTGTSPLV